MGDAFKRYFDDQDGKGDALDVHLATTDTIHADSYRSWFERGKGGDYVDVFKSDETLIEYILHQLKSAAKYVNSRKAPEKQIQLDAVKVSTFVQNLLFCIRFGTVDKTYSLAGLVKDFYDTLDINGMDYYNIGEAVGTALFGNTDVGVEFYGIIASAVIEFRDIILPPFDCGEDYAAV